MLSSLGFLVKQDVQAATIQQWKGIASCEKKWCAKKKEGVFSGGTQG